MGRKLPKVPILTIQIPTVMGLQMEKMTSLAIQTKIPIPMVTALVIMPIPTTTTMVFPIAMKQAMAPTP